jgi:hypothetical protein
MDASEPTAPIDILDEIVALRQRDVHFSGYDERRLAGNLLDDLYHKILTLRVKEDKPINTTHLRAAAHVAIQLGMPSKLNDISSSMLLGFCRSSIDAYEKDHPEEKERRLAREAAAADKIQPAIVDAKHPEGFVSTPVLLEKKMSSKRR